MPNLVRFVGYVREPASLMPRDFFMASEQKFRADSGTFSLLGTKPECDNECNGYLMIL